MSRLKNGSSVGTRFSWISCNPLVVIPKPGERTIKNMMKHVIMDHCVCNLLLWTNSECQRIVWHYWKIAPFTISLYYCLNVAPIATVLSSGGRCNLSTASQLTPGLIVNGARFSWTIMSSGFCRFFPRSAPGTMESRCICPMASWTCRLMFMCSTPLMIPISWCDRPWM